MVPSLEWPSVKERTHRVCSADGPEWPFAAAADDYDFAGEGTSHDQNYSLTWVSDGWKQSNTPVQRAGSIFVA